MKARLSSVRIPVSLALGGATAAIGRVVLTRTAASAALTIAAPSVTITVEAAP